MIPTMPFEAPWNAIVEWLGITDEDEIGSILPNRRSFQRSMLLQKDEVFVEGKSNSTPECKNAGGLLLCQPKTNVFDYE